MVDIVSGNLLFPLSYQWKWSSWGASRKRFAEATGEEEISWTVLLMI